jgi:hypothetical protein
MQKTQTRFGAYAAKAFALEAHGLRHGMDAPADLLDRRAGPRICLTSVDDIAARGSTKPMIDGRGVLRPVAVLRASVTNRPPHILGHGSILARVKCVTHAGEQGSPSLEQRRCARHSNSMTVSFRGGTREFLLTDCRALPSPFEDPLHRDFLIQETLVRLAFQISSTMLYQCRPFAVPLGHQRAATAMVPSKQG